MARRSARGSGMLLAHWYTPSGAPCPSQTPRSSDKSQLPCSIYSRLRSQAGSKSGAGWIGHGEQIGSWPRRSWWISCLSRIERLRVIDARLVNMGLYSGKHASYILPRSPLQYWGSEYITAPNSHRSGKLMQICTGIWTEDWKQCHISPIHIYYVHIIQISTPDMCVCPIMNI